MSFDKHVCHAAILANFFFLVTGIVDGQQPALSKEYIRLGERVIAIESPAASTSAQPAVMSAPVPGTQLASGSITFQWTAGGPGVDKYFLDVGNIGPGNGNLFAQEVTGTSITVNTIPCGSQTIYVQLWTHLTNGSWMQDAQNPKRYTYTSASGTCTPAYPVAVMTTPTPSTTLSGSTVTFQWHPADSANAYWLDVGTTWGGNIFGAQLGNTTTSQTVSGIPCTGGTIYVQLFTMVNGTWVTPARQYTYTAYNGACSLTV